MLSTRVATSHAGGSEIRWREGCPPPPRNRDVPNFPWGHVNGPKGGSSPGSSAPRYGDPMIDATSGACNEGVLDDPNVWPVCKCFVDPTEFGLCLGGRGKSRD